MKTSKLRQAARESSPPLASNFRIEVFHQSESVLTSVMGIEYLKQLLDVTGHLQSTSLQAWLAIILEAEVAPEFTLSNRREITFSVTLTGDAITQGVTRVH